METIGKIWHWLYCRSLQSIVLSKYITARDAKNGKQELAEDSFADVLLFAFR